MSERISYYQISAEIIDHACDDSGINLVNIEEEVDVTCIHSTNETNNISMNDDVISTMNIMHFYRKITTRMYPQEYNRIKQNAEFYVIHFYSEFIINRFPAGFETVTIWHYELNYFTSTF